MSSSLIVRFSENDSSRSHTLHHQRVAPDDKPDHETIPMHRQQDLLYIGSQFNEVFEGAVATQHGSQQSPCPGPVDPSRGDANDNNAHCTSLRPQAATARRFARRRRSSVSHHSMPRIDSQLQSTSTHRLAPTRGENNHGQRNPMLRRYIAQPRHEDVWAAPPHVTYQLTFGSNKANNDDDNNKNKSDIQNDDSEHKDGDSKL